ncbi:hypothetical protein [Streptomyces uncialis]|uniref:hypothetical protein n=1 Tax=Streptomyces uncialis TaxID=1048205 RepID=UPI00386CC673|nr:hypothetical protein OG924_12150 [Streptomyces uncialis]
MDDGADGDGGRRGGISARLTRYGAFLGTALAIASLLTLAGPAVTAEAASYCSGRVVRTVPFSGGEVVVHKKAGYVCAATVARRSGPRRAMSVGVQARGNREVLDRGRYRSHAGPVVVHAGNRCVRVSGSVGGRSVRSGWIMC